MRVFGYGHAVLVGVAVLLSGCVDPGMYDASGSPTASTDAMTWDWSKNEPEDSMTIVSTRIGYDWMNLDIRAREAGVGFRINDGPKIMLEADVYTDMSTTSRPIQAGDIVRYCAVQPTIQSAQIDFLNELDGLSAGSINFVLLETWCDDASASPSASTSPPASTVPQWTVQQDEANDRLTVVSASQGSAWDRLEFRHNTASTIQYVVDHAGSDITGSTGQATWKRLATAATPMQARDRLSFCAISGSPSNVLIEIRDLISAQAQGSGWLFGSIVSCASISPSASTSPPPSAAPQWSVQQDEANDRLSVISASQGSAWDRLEFRHNTATTIQYVVDHAGSDITGSTGQATWKRLVTSATPMQAGDRLSFCAISGSPSNVLIEIRDMVSAQLQGSWLFGSIVSCASISPSASTSPPASSSPAWSATQDEATDSLGIVSASENSAWERLDFKHNSATTIHYKLDHTGADITGSTAQGLWKRIATGATPMDAGDRITFCTASGSASNVMIEIRDGVADQLHGTWTFSSMDSTC